MINNLLSTCIDKANPATISKPVVDSIAAIHLKEIIPYMERFLTGVFRGGGNGITFKSITQCGVHETLKQLRGGPTNGLKYDITISDLVLHKIILSFDGHDMPAKYVYLPFCRDAGLLLISGSVYGLSSVISDKSLSPSSNRIFVRLFRDKIGITFTNYKIIRDGEMIVAKVLTSDIYHTKVQRQGLFTKSKPGPMLYLLAQYGYSETMQRVLGWVPDIVDLDYTHPDVVIYKSTGERPLKTYISQHYTPVTFAIAVPKVCDVAIVRSAIANFFYVMDHFTYLTPDNWDNTDSWKVILGKIICGVDSANVLMDTVNKHMSSLHNYVDSFMVSKLKDEYGDTLEQDFTKDGFFKILIVVLQRFEVWTMAADEITASTLDKRFETLYHLLYDIIRSVNSFSFDIEQNRDTHATAASVLKHFNKKVTRGRIYSIRYDNVTCAPVTYSGDHKYLKITSAAELQLSIPTGSNAKAAPAANATTTLHETQVYCSTLNAITMNRLSPVTYVNLFAPYDPITRTFTPTQEMLDDTTQLKTILREMPRRSSAPNSPKEFSILNGRK